ncbi:2-keto-4-pentenoate hydratase/2-oxohepta-3-ene-1,7-dioic acid hydratase (catechol pathway) [Roseomonas rosea]|uniref:2-keto-4-pentenoate hydratase/2-oxohepta-3-ene-1,7-dioic acid hydratase (Catechol pathway) n=1 Tax=Muricoccus roseus TaxID=198092 RepID=A0A1M6NGG8_9PROT|nr:fumarylacetoacetate hydrolase family protein [Roseomonas rosea]SHJ94757.1 2-keto-4-pentenoate hydratase/2-oxohepta-3-ene-1,7-dioic acid hydratase (catechol pathway) [Roseomonas rosea]
MRLIAFEHEGRPALGARMGEEVVALADAIPGLPADPLAAFASLNLPEGAPALAEKLAKAPRRPFKGLKLLPVVPRPGKIICIGLNYVEHAKEGNNPIPDYPAVFFRGHTSLAAHGEPLLRPKVSDKFDYEAELVIVVGQRAKHLTEANALSCVAGYTCMNEGSLRDYQRKGAQWTVGKNFDRTGGLGPEIVTPDEIPQGPNALRITSRVNGQTMQDSNTSDMIFSVPRILAILSEVMTLEPGDIIATGTPSGVGYPRKPPVFMKPGDTIEVEIEGVGTLVNTVEDEAA